MIRIAPFFLMITFLYSCSKNSRDQRDFAGVWEVDKITTVTFQENKEIDSKDTTFAAVLQLQNNDALSNNAFFEGWSPFGVSACNWDISSKKAKLINFHNFNMETGNSLFSYKFNVDKVSRNTLILTSFNPDDSLNLDYKFIWKFKRK